MKILHITSHLNIGGITRYILSLSERLVKQGHQVVVASGGGQLASQVGAMGAVHWQCPFQTSAEFSPPVFWGTAQLAARLRQEPVDIIHAHTRVAQVVADRISRALQIPYVTTWHGIYQTRLGRRFWLCAGDVTIAISELVRQHLLQDFHLPPKRIRCIYNGIDATHYAAPCKPAVTEEYRKRWQIPKDCPVIGGVGRLAAGRVKGFDTLLVAAYLLEKRFPDLHVLVVGDGPRRPFLEDIVKRLGIRNRVHFVGEVEDIRVPFALMDLFVFTSRWPEAFGLTLVEAMAAGKPVVATKTGAVPEVIRDGLEGWLVPPDDPAAMADGALRLLTDRSLASKFRSQGQLRVREAFSLDRLAREVEAVYREVLKKDPTPSA